MPVRMVLIGLLLALVAPVTVATAKTLDEVEAEIVKKWEKIETMTADMTMLMGLANPTPLKSKGTFEYMRDQDTDKKRMELSFTVDNEGQSFTMSQTVIFDGEFAWTIDRKSVV